MHGFKRERRFNGGCRAYFYPSLSAPFFRDGALHAFPLQADLHGELAYSPSGFAKAGIDQAPQTFMEWMEWMETWAQRPLEDRDQTDFYNSQQGRSRAMLVSRILEQQTAVCAKEGVPVTFDTPQMGALLNKLDAVTPLFPKSI